VLNAQCDILVIETTSGLTSAIVLDENNGDGEKDDQVLKIVRGWRKQNTRDQDKGIS
jgi:hypothetical protein